MEKHNVNIYSGDWVVVQLLSIYCVLCLCGQENWTVFLTVGENSYLWYNYYIYVIIGNTAFTTKHSPNQRVNILLPLSCRTKGLEILLGCLVRSLKSVNPKPITYVMDHVDVPLGTSQLVVFWFTFTHLCLMRYGYGYDVFTILLSSCTVQVKNLSDHLWCSLSSSSSNTLDCNSWVYTRRIIQKNVFKRNMSNLNPHWDQDTFHILLNLEWPVCFLFYFWSVDLSTYTLQSNQPYNI